MINYYYFIVTITCWNWVPSHHSNFNTFKQFPREMVLFTWKNLSGRLLSIVRPKTGLGMSEIRHDTGPYLISGPTVFNSIHNARWLSGRRWQKVLPVDGRRLIWHLAILDCSVKNCFGIPNKKCIRESNFSINIPKTLVNARVQLEASLFVCWNNYKSLFICVHRKPSHNQHHLDSAVIFRLFKINFVKFQTIFAKVCFLLNTF